MNKDQEKEFEAWFKEFNTWNLTGDDFLNLSFAGTNDGDIVFTKENSELTRYQANSWRNSYMAYKTGWSECIKKQEANNG